MYKWSGWINSWKVSDCRVNLSNVRKLYQLAVLRDCSSTCYAVSTFPALLKSFRATFPSVFVSPISDEFCTRFHTSTSTIACPEWSKLLSGSCEPHAAAWSLHDELWSLRLSMWCLSGLFHSADAASVQTHRQKTTKPQEFHRSSLSSCVFWKSILKWYKARILEWQKKGSLMPFDLWTAGWKQRCMEEQYQHSEADEASGKPWLQSRRRSKLLAASSSVSLLYKTVHLGSTCRFQVLHYISLHHITSYYINLHEYLHYDFV